MSTHEGHLRQSGILTWFGIEMAIMMSHIYMTIYNFNETVSHTAAQVILVIQAVHVQMTRQVA